MGERKKDQRCRVTQWEVVWWMLKNTRIQQVCGCKQTCSHSVCMHVCVSICVEHNSGMGVGCNHNQIEEGLQYQLPLWFTCHSRREKKEKTQKQRRCSWNVHLGKTCCCIKCQRWAPVWHSAKPRATITSTTITTTSLCLPLIKEKNNSDGEEQRYITCQLDAGQRQWGEM